MKIEGRKGKQIACLISIQKTFAKERIVVIINFSVYSREEDFVPT